jgi:dihydrolipoamide dehydrogenase
LFRRHKIRYLQGRGALSGPHLATVRLTAGETVEVESDKTILALGSRPFEIPQFPFDGDRILSSNHALELREVPVSVLIVGGGVIGCEFAFILSFLGAEVTVVEAMSRLLPLPSVDLDCSVTLQREMKKRKIAFVLDRTVQQVDQDGENLRATLGPSPFLNESADEQGPPETLHAQKMLVCIGRKANTGGIGLEQVEVKMDDRGWIDADASMQTSVPGIYAVGDVLGPEKIMLAHTASFEGEVAVENALGGNRRMSYEVVPGAIFTSPEVACVGLTEQQAKDQGRKVRGDTVLFRNLAKAQVLGEIGGQAKLVSDEDSGKLLGVHMVGPHATDLIAEGALALQMGCTVKDLAETIHAHPTLAEVMLETSMKAIGRPVHG